MKHRQNSCIQQAKLTDEKNSYFHIHEGFRLSENVVRKKSGEPYLGNQRKQPFLHETTREQRSRRENWTTRIQIALRVFLDAIIFGFLTTRMVRPKEQGIWS